MKNILDPFKSYIGKVIDERIAKGGERDDGVGEECDGGN